MAAFRTVYDTLALFAVVAAVARFANPAEPRLLAKSQFDAARADAGYPDAPRADTICRRVPRRGWREIVELALDNGAKLEITVGALLGEPDDHLLERDDAILALKTIAARLGATTLSAATYERECRRLQAENRRRRHAGELAMPNWNQIVRVFGGSPADALVAAGLKPSEAARPPVERGVDWTEALDRCIEVHGALPPVNDLYLFAAAQNFPLARQRLSRDEHVRELRERRAERGLPTPELLPKAQRPDFGAPAANGGSGRDAGDGQRRRKHWKREERVESLVSFLDSLPAGRSASLRAYQEFERGRPEYAPASGFGKGNMRFSVLLAEARELRRKRRSRS